MSDAECLQALSSRVSHAKQREDVNQKRSTSLFSGEKLHCRNFNPVFIKGQPPRRFLKRTFAAVSTHVWARNRLVIKMRENGYVVKHANRKKDRTVPPRSRKMRSERESVLQALVPAILYYVNLDPFSPGLFECERSVEGLARDTGLAHDYPEKYDGESGQYRHGRTAYDRVLAAIEDLQAAGLLFVISEFDKIAGQYKASRIFLRVAFFQSVGIPLKSVTEYLLSEERRLTKKGKLSENYHARMAKQERLMADGRIAGVDRVSIKNLLAKERDRFFGIRKGSSRPANKDKAEIHRKKPLELPPIPPKEDSYHLMRRLEDMTIEYMIPDFPTIHQIKSWMKKTHPDIPDGSREFFQTAIDELKSRRKK